MNVIKVRKVGARSTRTKRAKGRMMGGKGRIMGGKGRMMGGKGRVMGGKGKFGKLISAVVRPFSFLGLKPYSNPILDRAKRTKPKGKRTKPKKSPFSWGGKAGIVKC